MQLNSDTIAPKSTLRWAATLVAAIVSILPPCATAADGSFDSNGIRLHYTIEGAGQPVLLIHGFAINGTSQWVLPGVSKTLAKNYRVITIDNRGHGKSDKPHDPEKYGLEMVRDAIRLLDHLKIKKAHVVGYSMGGLIALKLTTMYPDRIISTTLGGMGLLRPAREPMLKALANSLDDGTGFAPLIVWLTPVGAATPVARQVEVVDKFLQATNDVKAMAALIRAAQDERLDFDDNELRNIKTPVLVLIGEHDPLQRTIDSLKERVPHAEVVVVKNGDHFNTVFKPLFLEVLTKHLTNTNRAESPEQTPP
jgi:pimeloyl-ACP methyl ester carboxylesterase